MQQHARLFRLLSFLVVTCALPGTTIAQNDARSETIFGIAICDGPPRVQETTRNAPVFKTPKKVGSQDLIKVNLPWLQPNCAIGYRNRGIEPLYSGRWADILFDESLSSEQIRHMVTLIHLYRYSLPGRSLAETIERGVLFFVDQDMSQTVNASEAITFSDAYFDSFVWGPELGTEALDVGTAIDRIMEKAEFKINRAALKRIGHFTDGSSQYRQLYAFGLRYKKLPEP